MVETIVSRAACIYSDDASFIHAERSHAGGAFRQGTDDELKSHNRTALGCGRAILQEEGVAVPQSTDERGIKAGHFRQAASEPRLLMRSLIVRFSRDDLAHGLDRGCFVGRHSCPQQIGDSNRRDEDEGNRDDAKVSEDEAGDGQAFALESARALLDFGKRNVAEDDGNNKQRKDVDDSTNQTGDGFATGLRSNTGGKRRPWRPR